MKLNQLHECQQLVYRTAQNPKQLILQEILSVMIGGNDQIEVAEDLLRQWPIRHRFLPILPP